MLDFVIQKGFKMENEIKLTKLASCAGCGAKVGAGTLTEILDKLPTLHDPRLIVGFDKSDDASVYIINDELALVQTLDFFPPIVDDPYMFGQIAATNALSDIYAMGGEPKLAMNIMCVTNQMSKDTIYAILRGGYEKAFEAGAIITGGHTIEDVEPKYGLSVSGFVHPQKVLKNSTAREGDVLILTKPLGVGILTTAAKADMVEPSVLNRVYEQMATLNKTARDIMVKYAIHSCTDITGFALIGHAYEMAQGSDLTVHLDSHSVPFIPEAYAMAEMGMIPAGAYRNRDYAEKSVSVSKNVTVAMQDIMYDPQTSGGLLMAVAEKDANRLLKELTDSIPQAAILGYATQKEQSEIILD